MSSIASRLRLLIKRVRFIRSKDRSPPSIPSHIIQRHVESRFHTTNIKFIRPLPIGVSSIKPSLVLKCAWCHSCLKDDDVVVKLNCHHFIHENCLSLLHNQNEPICGICQSNIELDYKNNVFEELARNFVNSEKSNIEKSVKHQVQVS